jgi:hypothetical protein
MAARLEKQPLDNKYLTSDEQAIKIAYSILGAKD